MKIHQALDLGKAKASNLGFSKSPEFGEYESLEFGLRIKPRKWDKVQKCKKI
jgi:hypothetical protein